MYLFFPSWPSWPLLGWTLPLLYCTFISDIIMQKHILNVGACGIHQLAYIFRVISTICTAYLIRQLRHELGFLPSFIIQHSVSTVRSLFPYRVGRNFVWTLLSDVYLIMRIMCQLDVTSSWFGHAWKEALECCRSLVYEGMWIIRVKIPVPCC